MSIDAIRNSRCPDCGQQELVAGPKGGASRNVYCPHCLRGWNIHGVDYGVIGVDSIGRVEESYIEFARKMYPADQPWRMPHHDQNWRRG